MVLIVKREDQRIRENEEKYKWIMSVLNRLGIPTDSWKLDTATENMMPILRKIRNDLKKFDLEIVDDSSAGIDIYCNGEMIASWKKPFYVLKQIKEEKDPKFRYYLEMHLNIKEFFD